MPAEETVDIREYVAVLRRRKILLLVVIIGFTGLSIAYSFSRTPLYTAQAEVLLLPASTSTQYRPDQLVSVDTEARLVRSAQVAELARDSLDWPVTLPNLLQNTNVQTTVDTLVLDIFYTNHDPQRAAEGANALADAYLTFKRQRSDEADLASRKGIQDQIDVLERQRNALDQKLSTLPVGSTDFKEAQQEQDAITGQIAVFTSQLASIPPVSDPGEVILPAEVPVAPSSPKHVLDVALGLFLGTFIGVVLAFVRDRVDERVTGRADLEATIDAPILASIPRVAGLKKRGPVMLVTEQQPRSPASEAYRTLRTGVMAMNRQRDRKVFAIVSPMPGEGKSSTAANLAVTLAQADKRVLLISRRPSAAKPSSVLQGVQRDRAGRRLARRSPSGRGDASDFAQPVVRIERSTIGAVGRAPPIAPDDGTDPQQRERFDYVIVDCPPVLGLADTLAMAPFVDAVLMVARAEKSKRQRPGACRRPAVPGGSRRCRRRVERRSEFSAGPSATATATATASVRSRTQPRPHRRLPGRARTRTEVPEGTDRERVSRRPAPLDDELVDGRPQVVTRPERAET